MNPYLLYTIPVIEPPETGYLDAAFWESVFAHDICILRGFLETVWPLDATMFTAEKILSTHGEEDITVLK